MWQMRKYNRELEAKLWGKKAWKKWLKYLVVFLFVFFLFADGSKNKNQNEKIHAGWKMVLREAEERKLWKNIIVHVFKRQGAHIPTQRIYDFVNLALRRAEEVSSDLYKKQRNFPGNHSVQSLCLLRMKEKKTLTHTSFLISHLVQISYKSRTCWSKLQIISSRV